MIQITDEEIRELFEQNGVMFVNRSYGLNSTKSITLDCLTKVVKEAIAKNQKKANETH